MTSIVINQEGVDVVSWSVFHEPRSPDLDDEQVSRNQEQCGPKTIQHKPTIDPFISQIPQVIRPLIKVSRNVHSIFHHVSQIRSTCFPVANFFLPFLPGLWKLNFLTRIGKELRFCAAFRPWMSDKTTKNKLSPLVAQVSFLQGLIGFLSTMMKLMTTGQSRRTQSEGCGQPLAGTRRQRAC